MENLIKKEIHVIELLIVVLIDFSRTNYFGYNVYNSIITCFIELRSQENIGSSKTPKAATFLVKNH